MNLSLGKFYKYLLLTVYIILINNNYEKLLLQFYKVKSKNHCIRIMTHDE